MSSSSPPAAPNFLFVMLVSTAVATSIFSIRGSFWIDEANSTNIAGEALEILPSLLRVDSHPPAFHLLQHFVNPLFGDSEIVVRMHSVAFTLLTLFMLYQIGKRYFDSFTGIVAATLYGISPLVIYQSHNARPYAMLSFLSLLATAALLRIAIDKTRVSFWCIAYCAIAVVGLFTHYWFCFVLLAHGLSALAIIRPRAVLLSYLFAAALSVVPFAIFWLPVLKFQIATNSANYIPRSTLFTLIGTIGDFYGAKKALLLFGSLLLATLFGSNKPLSRIWNSTPLRLLAIAAFSMLLCPWALSVFRPLFLSKTAIIALPTLTLVLAAIVTPRANRNILCGLLILFLGASLFLTLRGDSREPLYDDSLTAQLLSEAAGANDLVITTDLSAPLLRYYGVRHSLPSTLNIRSFPLEGSKHMGWTDNARYTSDQRMLQEDAISLHDIALKSPRTFVLFGEHKEISEVLLETLTPDLYLEASIPLVGERHREVLIYRPRVASSPPSRESAAK